MSTPFKKTISFKNIKNCQYTTSCGRNHFYLSIGYKLLNSCKQSFNPHENLDYELVNYDNYNQS